MHQISSKLQKINLSVEKEIVTLDQQNEIERFFLFAIHFCTSAAQVIVFLLICQPIYVTPLPFQQYSPLTESCIPLA